MLKWKFWYSNPFLNASVPNERWSSNCSRVAAGFHFFCSLKLWSYCTDLHHTRTLPNVLSPYAVNKNIFDYTTTKMSFINLVNDPTYHSKLFRFFSCNTWATDALLLLLCFPRLLELMWCSFAFHSKKLLTHCSFAVGLNLLVVTRSGGKGFYTKKPWKSGIWIGRLCPFQVEVPFPVCRSEDFAYKMFEVEAFKSVVKCRPIWRWYPKNFSLVLWKSLLWPYRHVVTFKPFSNSSVAWLLVVTWKMQKKS